MNEVSNTQTIQIADAIHARPAQVERAIALLDDGATVPFIARYRKEATEGLTDTQLRALTEKLYYLRELDERREVVLKSIREQELLTPELHLAILAANTKTTLEDLYLPYRPKRRTKAILAKAAGLEPLADYLQKHPTCLPEKEAERFINPEKEIHTAIDALEGAKQIVMEQFSEHAGLLEALRTLLWKQSILTAKCAAPNNPNPKFTDYANFAEPIKKIPSHRALALFRGRREGALKLSFIHDPDPQFGETYLAHYFKIDTTASSWLKDAIHLAWKTKIVGKIELELLTRLQLLADDEAILVFGNNLRDLLLAAPAGQRATMGLDPGIRTGVKVAVVDATGKLLNYATIFPHAPANEWHESIATLAKLAAKHHVELISIGNGTASRETDRLVADLIRTYPDLKLTKALVSEAGASVYSASELAALEFPDLDVSLRGAVSIARRLQDPLAELVKIDPQSIGVGQYQHDVNPARLKRSLDGVVEDCVNAVGVDVNLASETLLCRIAGLNPSSAKALIQYRNTHGSFKTRVELLNIPRIGDKTFEQAAGFLRITAGDNPLDNTGVHPEAYPLIEKIVTTQHTSLKTLMEHPGSLAAIDPTQYVDAQFGLPTIQDILKELEKPGRDPRPTFKTAQFQAGIEHIQHLKTGMILEGIISNVTNFGAFVDIGVHQDGLVHISALTDRFIRDPRTLVKAGDIVKVRVTEVDLKRKRISLSMRIDEVEKTPKATPVKAPPKATPLPPVKTAAPALRPKKTPPAAQKRTTLEKKPLFNTIMADALAKLKQESS